MVPVRNDLVVLFDDVDRLSKWWRPGQKFNRTPHDMPASSWGQAYDRLAELDETTTIRELHVWGHGVPGSPLINRRSVNLERLHAALPDLELVWWRSCDVHRGAVGKRFAMLAVDVLGATSVGHCAVISKPLFWRQRAICAHTLPDALLAITPWWQDDGSDLRGVSTFRMHVPPHAYRKAP